MATYGMLDNGVVVELLGLSPSQQSSQAGNDEIPFTGMQEAIVENTGDKIKVFPEDLVKTWEK